MEDRRSSKRKIKRPSYFEHFQVDESRDFKQSDSDSRNNNLQSSAVSASNSQRIKPKKVPKETRKLEVEPRKPNLRHSASRNHSQGKICIGFWGPTSVAKGV